MRDYLLPKGVPEHLTDVILIERRLKEGANGFIRFLLKTSAQIKNQQIPFLPNYYSEIKEKTKGGFFLYTRLFATFKKQYKIRGKIIFTDF
jgi:hypothetical protein